MKRTFYLLLTALVATMGMLVSSCKSDDVAPSSDPTDKLDGIIELDASKSEIFDRLLAYKSTIIAFKEDAYSREPKAATKAINSSSYLTSSITVCLVKSDEKTGESTLSDPLFTAFYTYDRMRSYGLMPSRCMLFFDTEAYMMDINYMYNNKVEVILKSKDKTYELGVVDMTDGAGAKFKDDPVKSGLINLYDMMLKLDLSQKIKSTAGEIELRTMLLPCLSILSGVCSADYTHSDEQAVETISDFLFGTQLSTKIESWYGTNFFKEAYDLCIYGSGASYQRGEGSYRLYGHFKVIGNKQDISDLNDLGHFKFTVRPLWSYKAKVYPATFDVIGNEGWFTADIDGLEPGDYEVESYYEFNTDDTGLYVPGDNTVRAYTTDNVGLFKSQSVRRFTVHEQKLDFKHIALVDATSLDKVHDDAYFYTEGVWGRIPFYRGLCEINSQQSRLYAVLYDEQAGKPESEWLKFTRFQAWQEEPDEVGDMVVDFFSEQNAKPENKAYYLGKDICTAPTANVMKALEKALKDSKDAFSDDPNRRTAVFVFSNRPYYTDATFEAVRKLWAELPSSKRLVIVNPVYTDAQLAEIQKNGAGKTGTWDELGSWSNTIIVNGATWAEDSGLTTEDVAEAIVAKN